MIDRPFVVIAEFPPVVASVLLAILATYVALNFADRLRGARERTARWTWIVAGSVAMGTGIWGMHFVGMSAARFPFEAAINPDRTAVSWLVAVAASIGFIVGASRSRLDALPLAALALLISCGVAAMHIAGMSALGADPAFTYRLAPLAAALGLAFTGAAVCLAMSVRLAKITGWRRAAHQLVTAAIFGVSLSGLHYLAMASADVAPGTICQAVDGLPVAALGGTVGLGACTLLVLMMLMTSLQQRSEKRATQLDGSLGIVREELRLLTMTDRVTGLPNRLVFQDRLRQAVARSDRDGTSIAVMFVDIDVFKALDHGWSDANGELIVRGVATQLTGSVRISDTVAAVGNDQFLILMDGLSDLTPALRVAETVRRDGVSAAPTLSIGIAVYPADGALKSLVGRACTAAEAATRAGGDCYRFFEAAMHADAVERTQWLEPLRYAVDRGELQLHYQPKFHAGSGAMAGVEALLRWTHPVLGSVSPGVFIPLAEKFGLITQIGNWVLEEACRQMAAWNALGIQLRVAVNVSVFQLRAPGLADRVIDALSRHDIHPRLLTCEITESGAMEDAEGSQSLFATLTAAGVQISIDDFGTGYSSLSYLRRLPIHQLKIDRSFVNDLCDCPDAQSVVAAIVHLAHDLRLEVVAEGVETACQRDMLVTLGCDKLQGFLLARPLSASVLTAQLIESRRHHASEQGLHADNLVLTADA